MDPVDSGTPAAPPSGSRPSLFGNAQTAARSRQKPAEAISILSSLDGGGNRKVRRSGTRRPGWWIIVLGSLFAVTIATALFLTLSRDTAAPVPEQPLSRALSPATMAVASAPATPANGNHAAATIEDAPPAAIAQPTPVPQSETASAVPEPPVANKAEGKPKQNEPVDNKAASAIPARAVASRADKELAEAQPLDSKVPDRGPGRPLPATQDVARGAGGKETKGTVPASVTADRDASLLAALVAYSEGRPATEIQGTAAATKSRTSPQQGSAAPSGSERAAFDPRRDVVTKEANVSTAELVRRCKTLGFFEGMLCRMRVCNNLWGKDPACPQNTAQQTSNP